MLRFGARVVAAQRVIESNFMGLREWIHAVPGDTGTVVHIDEEGFPTVRWHRTGTATTVNVGEDVSLMAVV